jgi:cyclophilin family peptidyl-prolyl cis-trans isomerase
MRRFLPIAVLPVLLAAAVLSACGSGGDSGTTADIPAGDTSGAPATTPEPATPAAATGCRQIDQPPPAKPNGGYKKPKRPLDTAKTWTLEFKTSCGSFTVTLDPKKAPNASASMVALAKVGFFTLTRFHRIVPDFVIQGGDPTGEGTGGPGYKTVDPPPPNAAYTRGVVAMAKAGNEAPGTAGSQFYVVTGADAGLPPEYAVIGKVTKGLATVERIGALGGPDEKPTQPVVLDDVTARGA